MTWPVIILSTVLAAQTTHTAWPPQPVTRLCGRLYSTELIPIKNAKNTFNEKTRSLRNVTIELYQTNATDCCEGQLPVAIARTDRWGRFRFHKLADGLYWMATTNEGRKYKLLVKYESRAKIRQSCWDARYFLDEAGNLSKSDVVTVD